MSNFLFLIFMCICCIESARILGVFPIPSISHQVVFRALTLELHTKGHELVVITPDPAFNNENRPTGYTEIDVHDISYKKFRESYIQKVNYTIDPLDIMLLGANTFLQIVDVEMASPQVQSFLNSEQNFDLIITESVVPICLGFSYKFKAPVIEMSSFYASTMNFMALGAPVHPFLYPAMHRMKVSNYTLKDKLYEAYVDYILLTYAKEYLKTVDDQLKKYFGEDIPSSVELEKNVEMLFVNTNPIWEVNRPVPPNVIFLGGLHMKEPKQLPKDLQSFLDSLKNNVIYVSFGTNVNPSQFPKDKIKTLVSVFSKLPYDIIWKWDKDDLPGKPKNIHFFKWLPQNDLLRHPKIKLFITQGGLQSTDEAIAAGVPVIGIPVIADQYFNTEKYLQFNIGKKLLLTTLDEKKLFDCIQEVLNNDTYRQNMVKLNRLMRDMPQTPIEKAVWWTEYVIRHKGAKHLRPPAADVSWSEFFELELIAVLLAIVLTVSALLVLIFYMVVKMILKRFKSRKTKLN